jgi:hypothetical protein
MQLLPSLVSGLKAVCASFPDSRKGRGGNIAIADFGMAAFSMFFMQSASFLAFQRSLERGQGRSNAQTLFGIGRIPSDNYIRGALDEADPGLLLPCFERMETLLAEPAMRQAFGRLGGRTLAELWSPSTVRNISARRSSAVRIVSPASGPTARPRIIIACCRRRWWRPATPRSSP